MDIQHESENYTFDDNSSCISVSNQYLQVNLPVEIGAYAELYCAKVSCCSEPVVAVQAACENACEYELVITQEVNIRIPIKYGANVISGKVQVLDTVDNTQLTNTTN